MRRPLLWLVAALALSPLAATAQPQQQQGPDPEQLLQLAERYYEQLEYEEALKILVQVHQVPGANPMHKARSFLYMGVCFTALGQAENAVLAFMELLKIKPNFRLPPGISPSIRAMFKEALTRLKLPEEPPPAPEQPGQPQPGGEEIPVEITAKAPGKAVAGQAVEVKIRIVDPKKLVQRLLLRWRRVGGPDFSTIKVPFKKGMRSVTARIPGATVGDKTGTLQYMVEAAGRGGMTLAHAGSMDEPHTVKLTEATKGKSKWAWWVLGIGGGLAVAGGVVAAVLLTRGDDNGAPANTADVTVTIH